MTNCGSDEQEPDTRLRAPGKLAMDSDALYLLVGERSRSGAARRTQARLTLGDLVSCRGRLSRRQRREMGGEKSAEAIVGRKAEGPNPQWARQVLVLDGRAAAESNVERRWPR
jgi:hypothetical protein